MKRSKRGPSVSTPAAPAFSDALDEGSRVSWASLLLVVALALLTRGAYFLSMLHSLAYQTLVCDSFTYDQWARQIASGNWLGDEVYYQTPLYPYFLGVVYSAFGPSVWAVRILQAALGSLACGALAVAGGRFFSPRVGLIAGVLLAVYPPALFLRRN